MPFPAGWPPRKPSGRRSIRFYTSGTTTTAFSDNGFLFADDVGANPYTPTPDVPPGSNAPVSIDSPMGGGAASPGSSSKAMIFSDSIRIFNDGGGVLEFSFDGTNVQGTLSSGAEHMYRGRCEAGIAVRASAVTSFRIEAW